MSGLTCPAPPPAVPALSPRSSGRSMVGPLRTAATGADGAAEWGRAGGRPSDWSGDASEAAAHAMTDLADAADVAVAVLQRVAGALDTFFDVVATLETRRTDLVEEHGSLADRQRTLAADAASYTEDEEAGLQSRATALQGDIDAFVTRIDTWTTDVARAEDTLLAELQASDTVTDGQDYLASRSGSIDDLVAGLVADGTLPPDAATMTPDELREWIIGHPEAAAALLDRRPIPGQPGPAGDLGALLQDAFVAEGEAGAFEEQRREDLRALFEGLPSEDAALLAMLYPSAVGNTNGVPFAFRADANAVAVVDALAREQEGLEGMREEHERHQHDWDLFGRNNDDLEEPISDAEARIALYESILSDDRQILLFDPSGDGAIAELHGEIGPGTRNVGVSVPGTGTDLAGYQGVADRSQGFVDSSDGSLAMISWMGGDLPDGIPDAVDPSYSQDLAPRLAEFSHDVREELDAGPVGSDVRTTYLGHSYGGAVVGLSETYGLAADRVLHVESAGVGHGVHDPDDLPASQAGVDRYSMTAPGDFIELTQGVEGFGQGHGADPDTFDGVTRLHTGDIDGRPNTGFDAHSDVFQRDSDAWQNMLDVLTGGEADLYRAPEYEHIPTGGEGPPVTIQTGWEPGGTVDVR